ncbi:MAG TPA: metallophosphoesterase [Bacteroidota bacterium]|nr:metallophosphoesterase [Bacteroidota bacterium]
MSRKPAFLIILLVLLSSSLSAQQTVTIFHFNDTHSHVFPWGPEVNGQSQNGAAARWIKRYTDLRTTATNPILLHGGDSFTGDLIFNRFLGRAEFELFDSIGVDAMVLGNHDFDLKPFRLKNAIIASGASFDFLSSNIRYNNDTSGLAQYVKPFTIKIVGGIKIGLFGLTTRSTTFYGESAPITFDSTAATARRMVDSLKARSVDLIVAVTHLGVREDSIIASQVNDIDVIVGGHSHTPLTNPVLSRNPDGDTTIIVQAGARWEYLGKLTLTLSGSQKTWSYSLESIKAPMPDDPVFAPVIQQYMDSITTTYGPVYSDTVGVLTQDFPPINILGGERESPMLNIITDAYRAATGSDIALEVAPLIRIPFYAGAISTSEVRQTFAWSYDPRQGLGKRLSVISMTGGTLLFLLANSSQIAFDFFGGAGSFGPAVQGSGIQYTLTGVGFFPTIKDVWIQGQRIENGRVYSITVNEFIADLIGRLPLVQIISRRDTTIGADVAVANYLRSISPFDHRTPVMGRVWDETNIAPLSFTIQNEALIITWNPISGAASYNLYRISSSGSRIKLNTAPIAGTNLTDNDVRRGEIFSYQLEEIRTDGRRFEHPPVMHQVGGLPTTTYLLPAFPNPFNASTKIVFGLKERLRASIRIYNLLGQHVATLVNEERNQGEYEVSWHGIDESGRAVSTGLYIVECVAGPFRKTQKVVLIR